MKRLALFIAIVGIGLIGIRIEQAQQREQRLECVASCRPYGIHRFTAWPFGKHAAVCECCWGPTHYVR